VSATLSSRRTLIALASILRSLDAWQRELIDLGELAMGVATHAAATERFAAFGDDVRIELRTLDELLQSAVAGRLSSDTALRSQVALLDRVLRGWFEQELFGTGGDARPPAGAAPMSADDRARRWDTRSRTLLADDPAAHLFTGFAGSCWRHGWVAVPVAGDQLGDAPRELERFERAVAALGVSTLVMIELATPPRWHVIDRSVLVVEPVRRSHEFDASQSLAGVLGDRSETTRGFAIFTDDEERFALVERDEHHVIAGPRAFIECYLDGEPLVEAWARFRVQIEDDYDDDEPPAHLLDAARDYPRASRRGLGAKKL
jgi:hypothetical protein